MKKTTDMDNINPSTDNRVFKYNSYSNHNFHFGLAVLMLLHFGALCQVGEAGNKQDCLYATNKIDETKGTKVKIMEREVLLAYGENSSVNSVDSILVYTYLASYNDSLVLYMSIKIAPAVPSNFGSILREGKLLLKLNNNDVIILASGKSENGHFKNGVTDYFTFYPVQRSLIPKLKSERLVKIRIYWSEGNRDYVVSNRDFFIRQISCIE